MVAICEMCKHRLLDSTKEPCLTCIAMHLQGDYTKFEHVITVDLYQAECSRTCPKPIDPHMPVYGLVGEVGELVDYLKKVRYHGHDEDMEHIKEEIGDIMWYLSILAQSFGLKLSDVAESNIAKLRRRYPDGFDQERSKNR